MRIDRYTQKMQQALQSAQDFAAQWQSPEIGNEHFLLALLDQDEGVTRPLLEEKCWRCCAQVPSAATSSGQ